MAPPNADDHSSLDNATSRSRVSLIRSLSEVEEEQSSDEEVETKQNGSGLPPSAAPPIVLLASPPRLHRDQNPQQVLWTTPRTATYATVISPSSPSFALPTARRIRGDSILARRLPMSTTTSTPENPKTFTNGQYTETMESCVPFVSLKAGLQRKASLSVQSWSKLLLTLDGRDKFTKLVQYCSRLLAWWLVGTARLRANSLKISLTTSRKAFRLGRSVIELQRLSDQGIMEWFLSKSCDKNGKEPVWKKLGVALKTLGLMGFWAFDNVSFLTGAGVLDDYSQREKTARLQRRQQLASQASVLANRSYFAGSVAGLITNWRCYREHRQKMHQLLLEEAASPKELEEAKQEQFVLFLALLKSICDALVFSNNPGLDFWVKSRGAKMHEGVHCLAGLISASTVLYNNYPNK